MMNQMKELKTCLEITSSHDVRIIGQKSILAVGCFKRLEITSSHDVRII